MASNKEYLDYVLDLVKDLSGITYKKMMGEYILYKDEIIFGGIYDNRFLVKKVSSLNELNLKTQIPYPGGKEMFLVDSENSEEIKNIVNLVVNFQKSPGNPDNFSKYLRSKNKNKTFTLISRDCIGGALYHQLGLKFLSPTINLFFTPEDFNYFCLNLKDYFDGEFYEVKDESIEYPVGELRAKSDKKLKSILVHFMHYETFAKAVEKWNERKKRINFDNIYVISSFCYIGETKTFTPELVEKWNLIPYKKMIFVDKHYGFDGEFVISKQKDCEEYAWLLFEIDKAKSSKKAFNKFNFIKFLND